MWYVDDILILGSSKTEVEAQATELVDLFTSLGVQVNYEKSQTEVTQHPTYLGMELDLNNHLIKPPTLKLRNAILQVKKLSRASTFVPSSQPKRRGHWWIWRRPSPTFGDYTRSS